MKVFNKMKVFNDAKKYRLYLGDDLKVRVSTKHGDFYALWIARLIMYKMLSYKFKRINRRRVSVTYDMWV